jgi:hypothetical protein
MRTLSIVAAIVLSASVAAGQSIATEVDVTAGYSTESVSAGATQIRAFGDGPGAIRFFGEVAWGARYFPESRPASATDVFGAAYPYQNRAHVIEAYGERTFRPGGALVGVRAGRFRTPFGISTRSDHAYTGFLRAPMIRYDDYFALSNNFLEHGADVIVGAPQAYFEASVGRPSDVGAVHRRPGFDTVLRGQAYYRSVIVGVSHYRAMPYQPEYFAKGRAVFTGVDVRWMYNGIQLRGEFLSGRPFDGTTTTGGYLDLLVHRVGMGPVTAVARIERLDYDTIPEFVLFARRAMAGARIRIPGGLTAQIAAGHQWRQQIQRDRTAFDFALTYSLRRDVDTHRP